MQNGDFLSHLSLLFSCCFYLFYNYYISIVSIIPIFSIAIQKYPLSLCIPSLTQQQPSSNLCRRKLPIYFSNVVSLYSNSFIMVLNIVKSSILYCIVQKIYITLHLKLGIISFI